LCNVCYRRLTSCPRHFIADKHNLRLENSVITVGITFFFLSASGKITVAMAIAILISTQKSRFSIVTVGRAAIVWVTLFRSNEIDYSHHENHPDFDRLTPINDEEKAPLEESPSHYYYYYVSRVLRAVRAANRR
jgi:hypothetical protein